MFWRAASYSVGCFVGFGIGHFVTDPDLAFVGTTARALFGVGAYGLGLLIVWKWSSPEDVR